MVMDKEGKPSFFKILLRDNEDYLPLPTAFAKEYLEGRISKDVVLEMGSRKWSMEYLKIEDRYYFLHGWLKFMKDNNVKEHDFLVFWLLSRARSTFKVNLYGPNGCLKSKNKYSTSSDDEDHEDDDTDTRRKRTKTEEEITDDDVSAEEDQLQDNLFEVKVKKKKKKRGRGRPCKKEPKGENDDDRDGKDEPQNDCSVEEDQQPSFSRLFRKSHKFYMPFTPKFVEETGIDRYDEVKLRNEKLKIWKVKIGPRFHEHLLYMTCQWTIFRKGNNLEIGDVCVFRMVKGNLIDVQVKKKNKDKRLRGRPPQKKQKFS